MVFTDFKQRIVTESIGACLGVSDPTLAFSETRSVDFTLWIGEYDVTNVVSLPSVVLDGFHLVEQKRIVFWVGCLIARKSR